MSSIFNSFFLVFISEMGDKTQLLSLVLMARFRRPWVILAGVFVATILNHALAASLGGLVSQWVSPQYLQWILAATFFGFGLWLLVPDDEGEVRESGAFGAFLTTLVSFFIAEMGDKTQLATVALGAQYASVFMVTLGSTLGMMASNALAIFFGDKLLKRIPMQWVRRFACGLFILFGILILLQPIH